MDKNVIIAIMIFVSIMISLISWYYYNHQPIYTLTLGNGKYPSTNDKTYPKTFITNGTGDGIFYGTDKITAVIVVQCMATDYLTPKPFLGMVVSDNGTMNKSGILTNIISPFANTNNWLGVFDLTPLLANAAKVSGYKPWAIGHINNATFLSPTINGIMSLNVGFGSGTSTTFWPLSVSGNKIMSESGNYGLSLTCVSPNISVTD